MAWTKQTSRPLSSDDVEAGSPTELAGAVESRYPRECLIREPRSTSDDDESSSSFEAGSSSSESNDDSDSASGDSSSSGSAGSESDESVEVMDALPTPLARLSGVGARSWALVNTFFMGATQVSKDDIVELQYLGFQPRKSWRYVPGETIPHPKPNEAIVFLDSLKLGLCFPCHPFVLEVLRRYHVQLHELTPNAFVHLGRFVWLSTSFGGAPDIKVFAPEFLLSSQARRVKVGDRKTLCNYGRFAFKPRHGVGSGSYLAFKPRCRTIGGGSGFMLRLT